MNLKSKVMPLYDVYKSKGVDSIDISIDLHRSNNIGEDHKARVLKVNITPSILTPYDIGRFYERKDGCYEPEDSWKIGELKKLLGLGENTPPNGVLNYFATRDLDIKLHPHDVEYCIAKLAEICSKFDPRIVRGEESINIRYIGKNKYDLERVFCVNGITKRIELVDFKEGELHQSPSKSKQFFSESRKS